MHGMQSKSMRDDALAPELSASLPSLGNAHESQAIVTTYDGFILGSG